MDVTVYEKGNKVIRWKNVINIEKKEFHILVKDSNGKIFPHELDKIEKVEIEF